MELIPITEFDQRNFPEITEDEKAAFISSTNTFQRATSITTTIDQVKSAIMFPQSADPLISGQLRCLEMIIPLAKNPNLIPKPELITTKNFDKLFPWFTLLHGNVLFDLAQKGEKLMNTYDYPLRQDLAKYRNEDKSIGHRKMPKPESIKTLLVQAFQDYSKIYYKYHDLFSTPQMIEEDDWHRLESSIYQLHLKICCIQPFKDGSNRVARLVENLLRLNTGLKFKHSVDKSRLLRDIQEMQDSDYKSVD